MANQQNSYTGSQGTGTNSADFSFTFPSFTTSEVKVEVDNVVKTLTTHYTVENFNTTSGGTVRFTAGNIPTGTTPLRIFRQTDVESPKAEFSAGASLKAGELNDNFKQIRHALQEGIGAVTTDRKVQRFNIEADSIDGTLIADDVVDSEHYVAGSIDLEHMSANSVDSDQYVDGSIDGVHIANDQIDSQHYAAGSIDLEHMSSQSVDEDNLKISNGGSNGQFLQKQSGNTGGLTWATPSASTPTDITVADESSDTTCFPLFVTAATGDLGPKSGSNLTFNSSSGDLVATSFSGLVDGGTF